MSRRAACPRCVPFRAAAGASAAAETVIALPVFPPYDQNDEYHAGIAQTESILSALNEGAQNPWNAGEVAGNYMKVLGHYMRQAADLARSDGEDWQEAAREEAFAVFARSLYITGALAEHIANAEGLDLEGVWDLVRARYDT